MDYFLLIVAIGLAGFAIWQILSKRQAGATSSGDSGRPNDAPETRQRRRASFGGFDPKIENVGPGGVVKLTAVGPEMQDLEARILSRHLYREDDCEWFELEGETADGKLWIDVEEDDGVEVSVSLRALDLEETGLTPSDLDAIAKAGQGSCEYDGRRYRLQEHGKALFHRDGDLSKEERVYYWDFATSDRASLLGFEQWGEGEYQVHLGQPIKPHQITVYAERDETQ